MDKLDPNSTNGEGSPNAQSQSPTPPKSASKTAEQPRQKRKKARRACLACQRAHLTCGDERPCHRCVKRGLEAECHDGMRKRAKYLHDAPTEALMPGAEQNFKFSSDDQGSLVDNRNDMSEDEPRMQQNQNFQQEQSINFNSFPQDISTSPHAVTSFANPIAFSPFSDQQSPLQHQVPPQPQMPTTIQPQMEGQAFAAPMFDAPDPSYNFDLSGINFSNNYGALEFGILNQMSSNVNSNMLHRNSVSLQESPSLQSQAYVGDSPEATNFLFNPRNSIQDWQGLSAIQGPSPDRWIPLQNNQGAFNQQGQFADPSVGYNIGPAPTTTSGGSPVSKDPDLFQLYGNGQIPDASSLDPQQRQNLLRQRQAGGPGIKTPEPPQRGQDGPSAAISRTLENIPSQVVSDRRIRDPSTIYKSVTKPHSYTAGFHVLIAMLHRRFPTAKLARIARALAAIRPSFISCMKTLTNEDLIFMEKCFQRQLFEYQDFIGACGTPTLVCRRTGEVAYAAKEFCALSGWSDSVLLGLEPNLNINKKFSDGTQSGSMSNSSRGGMNTPRVPIEHIRSDADRPQPIFLPELLDDDSVVDFYEDFAKLAFADSKGSVSKHCRLIKYKTKDSPYGRKGLDGDDSSELSRPGTGHHSEGQTRKTARPGGARVKNPQQSIDLDGLGSHSDMFKLGDKDGKIDCMYCWTVKRDVFEVPMMIVLNFLPIL